MVKFILQLTQARRNIMIVNFPVETCEIATFAIDFPGARTLKNERVVK